MNPKVSTAGDTDKARKAYAKSLYADLETPFDMKGEIVGQSIIGGSTFLDWVREETDVDGKGLTTVQEKGR
jgi:hypothetical protein